MANALDPAYSVQGGLPEAISITVHPKLHISANLPELICLITSGGIQLTVPIKVPSLLSFICFELPKSVSLQTPLLSIKTFAPLMSKRKLFINKRTQKTLVIRKEIRKFKK